MKGFLAGGLTGGLVALAVIAGAAVAGNGVGGVFNLGKTNNVDEGTVLTGNSTGAQLLVHNSLATKAGRGPVGGNVAVRAEASTTGSTGLAATGSTGLRSSGTALGASITSAPGIGLKLTAGGGDGLDASTTAGGKSAVYAHHDGGGTGAGVFAITANGDGVDANAGAGGDGVNARATAQGKSGAFAHHDGASSGFGLFAQSDTGPAIGMKGNGGPPITLDGAPFPAATAGFHDGVVGLPDDNSFVQIAKLNGIPKGTDVVLANLEIGNPGDTAIDCRLEAGNDADQHGHVILGAGDTMLTLMVFHVFAGPGSAKLSCSSSRGGLAGRAKIVAIQVSGGTNSSI